MRAFLLLAILSTAICVSASASAATLYVDGSVSSSGDGASWETALKTIQEGIDKALEGDTVTVAKGVYVENIQFNGKNIVLTSTGPLDPSVVANTIIDGNKLSSVVTFSGTETEACVLSGLTIRNGKTSDFGGGILGGTYPDYTHATIQNNTITANSAETYGGGLDSCNGTIENNVITGNSAGFGGGLLGCDGTIRNNTISANSADWGGGLYLCDGTILGNTITGNSASDSYGGLGGCAGTIQDNAISANSAAWGGGLGVCHGTIQKNIVAGNSAGADGGGLYWCDGTVQDNIIERNSAAYGGGLFDCNGTIQNNTITGNSAQYGGGLAYCHGAIRNCIIWGNTAPSGPQLDESNIPSFSCIQNWSGGGQGNTASEPRLVNPKARDYHLQDGSPCIDAGASGYWFIWPQQDADGNCRLAGLGVDMGCYEYGSSTDADGDLLSEADESAAGTNLLTDDSDGDGLHDGLEFLRGSNPLQPTLPGVFNVPSDIPTIQQSLCVSVAGDEIIVAPGTYPENLQFCGPDIILRSSDPGDPSVVASTVIDGGGAGPVVSFTGRESEACVLAGFTIRSGHGVRGGGIKGNGTRATIRNNTVTGNSARTDGGGLHWCDGTIQLNMITGNSAPQGGGLANCNGTIQSNTITGNSAGYGGGLYSCSDTIQNNAITGNSAEANGGGLFNCNGTIQNNTITGNSAGGHGGGLDGCFGTIQNNTIAANSAGEYGGGLYGCSGPIQNNTVMDNSAGSSGGGLAWCSGAIRNSVIWANAAPTGSQLHESSIPTYSCIQGWTGDSKKRNISGDPRFAGPDTDDFRLLPSSPCIDTGYSDPALPATDIVGMHRIMFGGKSLTVDMGAYEFYINDLTPGPNPDQTTVTWSSLADKTYSIFYTDDLLNWHTAIDNFPSSGNTTTLWIDDGSLTGIAPSLVPRRFYRLLENP